jgi:hypothetical protein
MPIRFSPGGCCRCGCDNCCQWNLSGYIVNMGVGGWTAKTCLNCALLRGAYVVDINPGDPERCEFRFEQVFTDVCGPFNSTLVIIVTITEDCGIELSFNYSNTATTSIVYYAIANPDCDGPWTLTKTSETHFTNPTCAPGNPFGLPTNGCQVCEGTMPPTITVTKV